MSNVSDVIGDTEYLRAKTIPFNAVHVVKGDSGSGYVALTNCLGFKHLLPPYAKVTILSDSLTCQVIGPVAADKAITAHVAVIPDQEKDFGWPTTPAAILTIGGSALVQHSLYVGARTAPISFANEAAHQIKPDPIVGNTPVVVYTFTVTGGAKTDVSYIKLSGLVEVAGIGFVKTWD